MSGEAAKAVITTHRAVGAAFVSAAYRFADRIAIVCGTRSLSYRELNRLSTRVCALLVERKIGRGAAVGLALPRGIEAVAAMLGVLRAGAAYVPLDPADPPAILDGIYRECGIALTLCTRDENGPVQTLPGPTLAMPSFGSDAESEPEDDRADQEVGPDDPAYVLYTSGSTGRPKGVLVPHRGILRLVFGCDYVRLGPEEVVLQLAPLSFDAATFEIFGALLQGGTLAIVASAQPSLQEIAAALRDHRVTTAWFTAGLFHLMVEQQLDALRPLRHLLAGGDLLSHPHVLRALAALTDGQLINGYGPTENTTFTCCHVMSPGDAVEVPVPIGRAINGTTVHILDESLRPLPDGVEGELFAGGDGVALGYAGRPDLTAERFLPDPFSARPGALLYRTGDRAVRRADGTILFRGRVDRQVKINGKRVELDAVEAGLRETGLAAAAAAVTWTDRLGQRRLRAFISPAPDKAVAVTSASVKALLAQRVPAHMVPAELFVLAALPLSASGKIDRACLAAEGAEMAHRGVDSQETSPKLHGTQQTVHDIWCRVLGRMSVGLDDNFFDLGGTSLQLVEAHGLLVAALPTPIVLMDLFDRPTVRGLAARIDGDAVPARSAAPVTRPSAAAARKAALTRAHAVRSGATR